MLCRYKIIPKSPIMTPLMSDTIFGHFCWALLYSKGEDYLTDFLNLYSSNKAAPVLFSSAFLAEHLPRPDLPPLSRNQVKKFVREHFGENKAEQYKGLSTIKDWNKIRLISFEQWHSLQDDYSDEKLFEKFVSENIERGETIFEIEVAASNTINRISGAVDQICARLLQKEKV